jgi:hypothetical protein
MDLPITRLLGPLCQLAHLVWSLDPARATPERPGALLLSPRHGPFPYYWSQLFPNATPDFRFGFRRSIQRCIISTVSFNQLVIFILPPYRIVGFPLCGEGSLADHPLVSIFISPSNNECDSDVCNAPNSDAKVDTTANTSWQATIRSDRLWQARRDRRSYR